jgi:membrane fusion protein (multidrug efflux system)
MRNILQSALLALLLLPVDAAMAQQRGSMAMPVKAESVIQDAVTTEITALGTLRSEEAVMIRPEIVGRIQTLHFQEGQLVTRDAPLVTLDQAEYRATLAGSTADMEMARISYERIQELYGKQLTSRQNLDEAKAKLDAARARQALDQVRLDKTVIHAPFAGVVGLRQVSPGAYVDKGNDIVGLGSIGSLKLDFRIPEMFIPKIKVGEILQARVDAYPDKIFEGTVYAIDPAVDEETRTVLLRARLPNPENQLRPGMFARLRLTLERRPNAILVPEQAIVPMGEKNFVFRVVDGKAALTPVTLGQRRPGQVEISAGLAATDIVVTDGQLKIFDGSPVMVLGQPAKNPTQGG